MSRSHIETLLYECHCLGLDQVQAPFSSQADLSPLLQIPTVIPDAHGLEPLHRSHDVLKDGQRQPDVDDPGRDVDLSVGALAGGETLERGTALDPQPAREGLEDDQERRQRGVDERKDELARQGRHDAVATIARLPVGDDGAAPHRDGHGKRQAVGQALQVRVHGGGGHGEGVPAHGGPGRGERRRHLVVVVVVAGEARANVGVGIHERGHAKED